MSNLENAVKDQVYNEGIEGGVNALNNEEFLNYLSRALDEILLDTSLGIKYDMTDSIHALEQRIKDNETD